MLPYQNMNVLGPLIIYSLETPHGYLWSASCHVLQTDRFRREVAYERLVINDDPKIREKPFYSL